MKKTLNIVYIIVGLLIFAWAIVTVFNLFTEQRPDYFEFMQELDEPLLLEGAHYSKDYPDIWVTHVFILNDTQVLFYGPNRIRHEGNTYVNAKDIYVLRTATNNMFRPYDFVEATTSRLNLIFQDELE